MEAFLLKMQGFQADSVTYFLRYSPRIFMQSNLHTCSRSMSKSTDVRESQAMRSAMAAFMFLTEGVFFYSSQELHHRTKC